MRPIPRSSITGTGTGTRPRPRSRAPLRARRPRPRPPWGFGVPTGTVPYVFAPLPDAGAIPDSSAAYAPGSSAPVAADSGDPAEPADEPEDGRELGVRSAPLRPAVPRARQGVTATLDWREFDINQFPISPLPPPGGGIYLVRSTAGPLYVGEAGSFAERWTKRLREAFQGGLIERDLADRKLRLWLGTIHPSSSTAARKTLEAVIVRTLSMVASATSCAMNDRSRHSARSHRSISRRCSRSS